MTIDIHRLAREAGAAAFYPTKQAVKDDNYVVGQGFLEKFAALVAAHEREECAQIAYQYEETSGGAAAIRART